MQKVKENVQEMAEWPYIGVDMAAGEDMTAYAWQQDVQKPAEAAEGNQEENSAQETGKGQEGASGEAIDAVKELLAMIPEERREQQLAMVDEFCKRYEITAQELAEALIKLADNLKKAWEKAFESIQPAIEHMEEFCREYFSSMDKWELEKLKMPNNERRRRGMPMVRRRARIRNGRKRRRRK